ncbi:MAG TPA: squalene/phytoene synthase family protein, partial [Rhizomicrobium sp.]|nr:squalene/phytoene synthase family protein [Rhizomicrobium sp.]
MDPSLTNRLAASVRSADPDRYFSALFAPASLRPLLFVLYAFNAEVARVAETVREPMLGAIRLEWWRESAEGASRGAPRHHDVARGLAALFAQ